MTNTIVSLFLRSFFSRSLQPLFLKRFVQAVSSLESVAALAMIAFWQFIASCDPADAFDGGCVCQFCCCHSVRYVLRFSAPAFEWFAQQTPLLLKTTIEE